MNLQKCDVDMREVVVETFRRIQDKSPNILVVFIQLGLKGSANESTANYAYVNHDTS